MHFRGSMGRKLAKIDGAYDFTCDMCRHALNFGREVLRVVDDFEHQFCCKACADKFERKFREQ